MADLANMSKKQLETYARKELGVELDRRHSKKQLLAEVQELSEKEVKVLTPSEPKVEPQAPRSSTDIRAHVEKFADERRDCAVIWTLIKNGEKYRTNEDILDLIKAKQYETLLGEVS